jgi:hypothetical protein
MRNDAAMGRAVEAAAAPGTSIAVTTGANPEHGRATAMTMVRGRLGAVRVTSDKDRMSTAGTAIPIRAGPSATATVKSAIARRLEIDGCPWDKPRRRESQKPPENLQNRGKLLTRTFR